MRRWFVPAGILTALLTGCSAFAPRDDGPATPEQWRRYQELSQAAQVAIDQEDYGEAQRVLLTLLNESPRFSEAQHRLGRVFQAQAQLARRQGWNADAQMLLQRAEAAYRRALELDKEYVDALVGLGEVQTLLERPDQALPLFEEAIEIDPHKADAHLGQGIALESLGQTNDALAAYYRVLERQPDATPALFQVATLQLNRDRPDQALALLNQLLDHTPDQPEAHFRRGQALLATQRPAEAAADLRFAAERLHDRPDVYYHLALALEQTTDHSAALLAAERALELAPDFTGARDLSQRLRR